VVTARKATRLKAFKPMVPEEQLEEKEGTSLIASSIMLLPMPLPCGFSTLRNYITNQQFNFFNREKLQWYTSWK
jgi:hypothetical protein